MVPHARVASRALEWYAKRVSQAAGILADAFSLSEYACVRRAAQLLREGVLLHDDAETLAALHASCDAPRSETDRVSEGT